MGDTLRAINVDQLTQSVNTAIHGNPFPPAHLPFPPPPPPQPPALESSIHGAATTDGFSDRFARLRGFSEGSSRLPRFSESSARLSGFSEDSARLQEFSEISVRFSAFSEGAARLPVFSEVSARLPGFSEGSTRFPGFQESSVRFPGLSEGSARFPAFPEGSVRFLGFPDGSVRLPRLSESSVKFMGFSEGSARLRGFSESSARLPSVPSSGFPDLPVLNSLPSSTLPVHSTQVSGENATSIPVPVGVPMNPMDHSHPPPSPASLFIYHHPAITTTTTITTTVCHAATAAHVTVRDSHVSPLSSASVLVSVPVSVTVGNAAPLSSVSLSVSSPVSAAISDIAAVSSVTHTLSAPASVTSLSSVPVSLPVSVSNSVPPLSSVPVSLPDDANNNSIAPLSTASQSVSVPAAPPMLIMFSLQLPVPASAAGQGVPPDSVTASSLASQPGPRHPLLPPFPLLLPFLPPPQDARLTPATPSPSSGSVSALPFPPVSFPLPPLPLRLSAPLPLQLPTSLQLPVPASLQIPASLQNPTSLQVPVSLQVPTSLQVLASLQVPTSFQVPGPFQLPASLPLPPPHCSAVSQSDGSLPPLFFQSPVCVSGSLPLPPLLRTPSCSMIPFPCPPPQSTSSHSVPMCEGQASPVAPPCPPQSFATFVQNGLPLMLTNSVPMPAVQTQSSLVSVSSGSLPLPGVQSGVPLVSLSATDLPAPAVQSGMALTSVTSSSLPLPFVQTQSGIPLMSVSASSLPLPAVQARSDLPLTSVSANNLSQPDFQSGVPLMSVPALRLCHVASVCEQMDEPNVVFVRPQSHPMPLVTCGQTATITSTSVVASSFPSPAGLPPLPPLPLAPSTSQRFLSFPSVPAPPVVASTTDIEYLPIQPSIMSGAASTNILPPLPVPSALGDNSLPLTVAMPMPMTFSLSSGASHGMLQASGAGGRMEQPASLSLFPPQSLPPFSFNTHPPPPPPPHSSPLPPSSCRLSDSSSSPMEYSEAACETDSENDLAKNLNEEKSFVDEAADTSPQVVVMITEKTSAVSGEGENDSAKTLVSGEDVEMADDNMEGEVDVSSPSSSHSSHSCAGQGGCPVVRTLCSTLSVNGQLSHGQCQVSQSESSVSISTLGHCVPYSVPCTRPSLSSVSSTITTQSCPPYSMLTRQLNNVCGYLSEDLATAHCRASSGMSGLPVKCAVPQDKNVTQLVNPSSSGYVSVMRSHEDASLMVRCDTAAPPSTVYTASLIPVSAAQLHVSHPVSCGFVSPASKTVMQNTTVSTREVLSGPSTASDLKTTDRTVCHHLKHVSKELGRDHPMHVSKDFGSGQPHPFPSFYPSVNHTLNSDFAAMHGAHPGPFSFPQCLLSCAVEAQEAPGPQGVHQHPVIHSDPTVLTSATQGSFHNISYFQQPSSQGVIVRGTEHLTHLVPVSSSHQNGPCQFSQRGTQDSTTLPSDSTNTVGPCQCNQTGTQDLTTLTSQSSLNTAESCQFRGNQTISSSEELIVTLTPSSTTSMAEPCQFQSGLSSLNPDFNFSVPNTPTISVDPPSQTLLPSMGYSPPGLSNQGLSPHMFSPLALGGVEQHSAVSPTDHGSGLQGVSCGDGGSGNGNGSGGISAQGLPGVSGSVLDMLLLKADLSTVHKGPGIVTSNTTHTPVETLTHATSTSTKTVHRTAESAENMSQSREHWTTTAQPDGGLCGAGDETRPSEVGISDNMADSDVVNQTLAPIFTGQFCVECNKVSKEACTHGVAHYQHVSDSPVLTRARATLPSCLCLRNSSVQGHLDTTGVFTKTVISSRTEFGPLQGKMLPPSDDTDAANFSLWKIFYQGGVSRTLDISDENSSNWLMFVKPARNAMEQNLLAFQRGHGLMFVTTKDLEPDLELLFWFSPDYCRVLTGSLKPPPFCPYCPICSHVFFHRTELRRHSRQAHGHTPVKKWTCSVCSGHFRSSGKLHDHVMTQHMQMKPHVCPTCGKEFADQRNLKAHLPIHTGIKRFGCDVCGKHFTQKSHLKSHHVTHTKVKAVQCRYCSKCFVRTSDMRQHELTHTQEKGLSCQVCSKTFHKPKLLRRHLRSVHHNERNYMCEHCSKTFHTKYKLTRHAQSCKSAKAQSATSTAASSHASSSSVVNRCVTSSQGTKSGLSSGASVVVIAGLASGVTVASSGGKSSLVTVGSDVVSSRTPCFVVPAPVSGVCATLSNHAIISTQATDCSVTHSSVALYHGDSHSRGSDLIGPGSVGLQSGVVGSGLVGSRLTFTSVPLTSSVTSSLMTLPASSSVSMRCVPVTSLPLNCLSSASSLPLNSIPVSSLPINSVALTSLPLNSVTTSSLPLHSVALTSVSTTSLHVNAVSTAPLPLNSVPLTSLPMLTNSAS